MGNKKRSIGNQGSTNLYKIPDHTYHPKISIIKKMNARKALCG